MSKQNIPDMLKKLDQLYNEEEQLKIQMIQLINKYKQLTSRYKQIKEDKELVQNLIMYQSNKNNRTRG